MKKRMLIILFLVFSIGQTKIQSQTVLIDPTGDGGFETGATFAANGWTESTQPANSVWEVGNIATAYAGTRGAFVSNPAGTYSYNSVGARTSHFYRDVVIPAGATSITLSFYWKGQGESGYDRGLVYTAPTTVTPIKNVPASPATTLTGATLVWTQPTFTNSSTYTLATITLPISLAGTTTRIIFTWQNDGSGGTTPGAAIDNISLTYIIPVPCAGTPSAGTTAATVTSGCSGYSSILSVTGVSVESGLTYQWESSPTGAAPWTPVTGATSATYTATVASNLYYRRVTTCTASGLSSTASSIQLTLNSNLSCFCASSATSTSDMDITKVTFGTINNTTAAVSLTGSQGTATGTAGMYSNWTTSTVPVPAVMQGTTTPISIIIGGSAYSHRVDVYFDFNQDGDLMDAGESFSIFTYANPTLPNTSTANIAIPISALPGNTLMRVVCVESSAPFPCGTYTWGETEDYIINITASPLCSGTPTGGIASATNNSSCSGFTSDISVTGSSVNSGLSYQWESSPTGGAPWVTIAGATGETFSVTTSGLYYRRLVTCVNSGGTAYSTSLQYSSAGPANDNCINATPINPDLTCTGAAIVNGTIACTSNSGISSTTGTADDDVWFSFVAESTTVKVTLGNTEGTDLVTQFFTGTCGSLVSAGYYDTDPSNKLWNGLSIGTTYYIRVYSYGSTAITGTAAQFNLCVKYVTPPTPPTVQPPCTNLGFESGFTGWYGTEGNSIDGFFTESTPLYIPDVYNETTGTNFAIVTAGTDPIAPINMVYSGTQSLKLGNEATYETYNGASIEQIFTVTATNTNFEYNYAVVLEDGAHPDYEQPFFQVQIFDGSGNEVTCGSFQATAPGAGASFIQIGTTDYYYKPWTTGSVNLTAYIGQNMTVRFTVSDCSLGAHPGYAYIDCSCAAFDTIEPKTICLGQSATLTAPSGAASYSWTPGGATTQSITVSPTTTTTYTCNITPTGVSPCNFSLSADVTIFSSELAIASSNSPICNGSVLNLTSSPIGGTSYSWSGPNGFASSDQNPSISVANTTAAGIYMVTVSLAGGCSGTASTTVVINTLPVPIIQNNTGSTILTCTTNPINVTAIGGNTYSWDDESTTATNSFTTPGTYTVTATSASGCSSTTSISITRDASFPIAQIENNTQTTELTCTTPIIYVTANGGVTYAWSGGTTPTTSENNFTSPGTYTVTVTGTETCTATSSITITQNTTPPTPSAFNNGPICSGEDFTLTVNGGSTYVWSGPNGFSSILSNPSVIDASSASAGSYSVTATGLNGCTATAQTTVVINPLPIAGFTYNSAGPTVTFTNTSTNATSYFWNFGGPNSTTGNPVYTFAADGQYNVSLIAFNGNCSDTTMQLITVSGVGIATNEINSISIYPNPTIGIFTLKLDAEANNALMTIVDVTGRIVFQKMINGNEESINLSNFAPGVYEVKLNLDKRVLHQRLIVK